MLISLNGNLLELTDTIVEKLELDSRSAAVRRALVLLELAVHSEVGGKKLGFKVGDEFEPINIK